jgi:hypothetical protein
MLDMVTARRSRAPWSMRRGSEPERQCLGCHRTVQGRRFCRACRKRIEDGQPVEASDCLSYDDVRWLRRWSKRA